MQCLIPNVVPLCQSKVRNTSFDWFILGITTVTCVTSLFRRMQRLFCLARLPVVGSKPKIATMVFETLIHRLFQYWTPLLSISSNGHGSEFRKLSISSNGHGSEFRNYWKQLTDSQTTQIYRFLARRNDIIWWQFHSFLNVQRTKQKVLQWCWR